MFTVDRPDVVDIDANRTGVVRRVARRGDQRPVRRRRAPLRPQRQGPVPADGPPASSDRASCDYQRAGQAVRGRGGASDPPLQEGCAGPAATRGVRRRRRSRRSSGWTGRTSSRPAFASSRASDGSRPAAFAASSVPSVARDVHVRSLKASRRLVPDVHPVDESTHRCASADRRRPPHLSLTGAGVVVGVVDWGCDVGHPNFRRPDGSTRLLALWDQRDTADGVPPAPYGYGTCTPAGRSTTRWARTVPTPPSTITRPTPTVTARGRMARTSSTSPRATGASGSPVGIAPEADLVFVHLANRGTVDSPRSATPCACWKASTSSAAPPATGHG